MLILIRFLRAYPYNGSLYTENGSTDFQPISELFQADGDVALIFLSANNVYYSQEIDDPWYAAHEMPGRSLHKGSVHFKAYFADEPASVIGCKSQYQNCDQKLNVCSPLSSSLDMVNFANSIGGNRTQAIGWVTATARQMTDAIAGLGSSSLASRFTLNRGSQGPLPDNQWQLEVENWHNIMLASYQDSPVQSAKGPGDSGMLEYFWKRPETNDEEYFCRNQVCRKFTVCFIVPEDFFL